MDETVNNMDSTRLWIRDNCNMDRVQSLVKKVESDNPGIQEQLKVGLYILGAVLASIYLIYSIVNRRTSGQSWLKLQRTRSPDPEKSNNPELKAATRPYGSELQQAG